MWEGGAHLPRHKLEISGQLHVAAALIPGENAGGIRELRWVGITVGIKDLGKETIALSLSSPATSHTWFAVLMNTWKTTEFMMCHIFLIDTCCHDHR